MNKKIKNPYQYLDINENYPIASSEYKITIILSALERLKQIDATIERYDRSIEQNKNDENICSTVENYKEIIVQERFNLINYKIYNLLNTKTFFPNLKRNSKEFADLLAEPNLEEILLKASHSSVFYANGKNFNTKKVDNEPQKEL